MLHATEQSMKTMLQLVHNEIYVSLIQMKIYYIENDNPKSKNSFLKLNYKKSTYKGKHHEDKNINILE